MNDPLQPVLKRTWFRRLVAVVFGLMLLVLLELGLRLSGIYGKVADDPYVGFSRIHPLFIREGDNWRTAHNKLRFFPEEVFPVAKPAEELRLFVLGGSTVNGRPYQDPTSFCTWLELGLNAMQPDLKVRVVNCGGVSYASYRLTRVLEEVLRLDPDGVILCTGHNEFLEDRSYPEVKLAASKRVVFGEKVLHRLHLFRAMRDVVARRQADHRFNMEEEVTALLDYRGGLEVFERNDNWRQGVIDHFKFHVSFMHELCEDQGVPFCLVIPPSNLKDCPPFKSIWEISLSLAEQETIQGLLEKLETTRDAAERLRLLEGIRDEDKGNALTLYRLGRTRLELARSIDDPERKNEMIREAYENFLEARNEDVCSLRIPRELEGWMRNWAKRNSVDFFDAAAWFMDHSPDGITGDEWLVDHVHPSIEGHQVIATNLMNWVEKTFRLPVVETSRNSVQATFDAHLESLPESYISDAEFRLNGLRAWAEGRVDGATIKALDAKRSPTGE